MMIGVFSESYLWLKAAKELGYKIIATHPLDIRTKSYYDISTKYIDKFFVVDYFDYEKLLEIATKNQIEFVICHPTSNDATLASSYINNKLKLKGVLYEAASVACNKYNFYKFLESNNLPTPNFTYKTDDNLDYSKLTYPCIVKPAYGAGSLGVKIIENEENLKLFLKEKNYNQGYALTKSHYDFYIVQQFVFGEKIMGCHSVVSDGELNIFARTYRDLSQEDKIYPYCYGQEFVTTYDPITEKTFSAIKKLIKTLKVNNTPFDLEVLLDKNNDIITFIELNLRPAEKAFNYINGREGYEYCIKEQVKLGTELTKDFNPVGDEKKFMGLKYFKFKQGTVKSVIWPNIPNTCIYFNSELKLGSIISNVWNSSTALHSGHIILLDNNLDRLTQSLDNFTKNIKIIYEGEP